MRGHRLLAAVSLDDQADAFTRRLSVIVSAMSSGFRMYSSSTTTIRSPLRSPDAIGRAPSIDASDQSALTAACLLKRNAEAASLSFHAALTIGLPVALEPLPVVIALAELLRLTVLLVRVPILGTAALPRCPGTPCVRNRSSRCPY